MRAIRFRAWDKHFMMNMDELTEPIEMEGLSVMDYLLKGFKTFTENYTLMQYTGLKDKNGKEIAELDIVISSDGLRKYKVSYDDKIGRYYGEGLDNAYSGNFLQWDNFEIIGNIYETPELLKEKVRSLS